MTERWERHAVQGTCEYCGEKGPVMPDPFGQQPACQPCWELIAYGGGRVTAHAIVSPGGKLIPGYLQVDGTFVDLNGGVWTLAEDGTWTPPAVHLDEIWETE